MAQVARPICKSTAWATPSFFGPMGFTETAACQHTTSAWSCCSKRWGSRRYFLYPSELHQVGLLANTCSPTHYWVQPAGCEVEPPTWGTVSLYRKFCSCSCCSFISKPHPWFLARAGSKAPSSPVLQTQGIQEKIGSVNEFSDFFQNFEHPLRQLPLRKATGVNLRCDSESQVPILVQRKASVLNSAYVTSLTAAKTNCVRKMNRGHVTYVNWASQFVVSVTLL